MARFFTVMILSWNNVSLACLLYVLQSVPSSSLAKPPAATEDATAINVTIGAPGIPGGSPLLQVASINQYPLREGPVRTQNQAIGPSRKHGSRYLPLNIDPLLLEAASSSSWSGRFRSFFSSAILFGTMPSTRKCCWMAGKGGPKNKQIRTAEGRSSVQKERCVRSSLVFVYRRWLFGDTLRYTVPRASQDEPNRQEWKSGWDWKRLNDTGNDLRRLSLKFIAGMFWLKWF